MHLINILVVAISVLTILSALALVFGSTRAEKARSLWFLTAAIGEVLWGCSIAFFLSLGTGEFDHEVAPWLIKGIYVGAILMDSTILGYVAWKYKIGKILTSAFLIVGLILSVIFIYDHTVLYDTFTLSNAGNTVNIDMTGWFYIAYIIYFCTLVPSFCGALIYRIKHASSKESKKGYLFFLFGLAVAGFLSLIFDLIGAPAHYELIWVGPLAIGLIMIGFYYAILKFRIVSMSASWLKILSSIVILSSAVIVYLLIFHLVFSALFSVANPSFQVILLNFIMIAIVLLLSPAISEIMSMARALIMNKQIDMVYVVKKLTKLNRSKIDFHDISSFLAEYMHFSYVGFLVGDKYYVAKNYKISADELKELNKLEKPERGIWQSLANADKNMVKEYGVYKVAVLTNASGDQIGQVVLGRPTTKATLDKKDLVEVEMIISLMGTIIENGSRSKS